MPKPPPGPSTPQPSCPLSLLPTSHPRCLSPEHDRTCWRQSARGCSLQRLHWLLARSDGPNLAQLDCARARRLVYVLLGAQRRPYGFESSQDHRRRDPCCGHLHPHDGHLLVALQPSHLRASCVQCLPFRRLRAMPAHAQRQPAMQAGLWQAAHRLDLVRADSHHVHLELGCG